MHAFGRAFTEKKMYDQAAIALQDALLPGNYESHTIRFDLARICTLRGAFGEAGIHLQEFKKLSDPDGLVALVDPLVTLLEHFGKGRKHALLVGIDTYLDGEITPLRGAANDVGLMKKTLVEYNGFLPGDITLLVNEEATAMAVLDAFEKLTRQAKEEAALFYFSGYGSAITREILQS